MLNQERLDVPAKVRVGYEGPIAKGCALARAGQLQRGQEDVPFCHGGGPVRNAGSVLQCVIGGRTRQEKRISRERRVVKPHPVVCVGLSSTRPVAGSSAGIAS